MRHGEVWEVDRRRMLVVSGDGFNDLDFTAVVVPLMRPHGPADSPYLVFTTEADQVSGLFVIPAVQPAPTGSAASRRLALISGATMSRVTEGLAAMFAY